MILPKEAQRSSQAPITPETGQDCSSALRLWLCRVWVTSVMSLASQQEATGIQGTAGRRGWVDRAVLWFRPQVATSPGKEAQIPVLSPFAHLGKS